MDTTSMFDLMDLIIVGGGLYVIYLYIVMVRSRKLENNMLLPKEIDAKKCKDVEGYINYIGPKMLAFGIVATLCGLMGIAQDYTQKIGYPVYLAGMAVFVVVAVWYSVAIKKGIKEFWGK